MRRSGDCGTVWWYGQCARRQNVLLLIQKAQNPGMLTWAAWADFAASPGIQGDPVVVRAFLPIALGRPRTMNIAEHLKTSEHQSIVFFFARKRRQCRLSILVMLWLLNHG